MSLNHQVSGPAFNVKDEPCGDMNSTVQAATIPFTGHELSEISATIERCEARVYRISGAELNNPTAEGFIEALKLARQYLETHHDRSHLVKTLQDQPLQQSNHSNFSPNYIDLIYELPLGWNDTLEKSLLELSEYCEALSDVQRRWFKDCVEILSHHNQKQIQAKNGTSPGTGRAYLFQVAKSCILAYLAHLTSKPAGSRKYD